MNVKDGLSDGTLQSLFKRYGTTYADEQLSADKVTEEMVADAFATILRDSNYLERFAREDSNEAGKLRTVIREIIGKIQKALGNNKRLSQAQIDAFSELQEYVQNAKKGAGHAPRPSRPIFGVFSHIYIFCRFVLMHIVGNGACAASDLFGNSLENTVFLIFIVLSSFWYVPIGGETYVTTVLIYVATPFKKSLKKVRKAHISIRFETEPHYSPSSQLCQTF